MKTKILIISLLIVMVAVSVGIGVTDYKQRLIKDAKADSVNYITLEDANAKTKAVFKEELAVDVARKLKPRKEGVTIKTIMSISTCVNLQKQSVTALIRESLCTCFQMKRYSSQIMMKPSTI